MADARPGFATTLLICLLLAQPALAAARSGFDVRRASTRLEAGVVLLDAEIDFRFSDDAIEAISNGVPLTVSVEMQVLRERRGPDKRIAVIRARYRVKTHALSSQYVITNLGSGEARTYGSFEDMQTALGRIQSFPLVDVALLTDQGAYHGRLRAKLDIEALPAPMRPLAYVKPSWRLKSDWFTWEVDL